MEIVSITIWIWIKTFDGQKLEGKFEGNSLDSMFETGCTLAHIPADLELRRDHQVIHQAAGEVQGKLGIRSDDYST